MKTAGVLLFVIGAIVGITSAAKMSQARVELATADLYKGRAKNLDGQAKALEKKAAEASSEKSPASESSEERNEHTPEELKSKAREQKAAAAGLRESEKSLKTKAVDSTAWPDSLPLFLTGFTASLMGLGMWWKVVLEERAAARATADGSSESSELGPVQLVQQLLQPLKDLEGDIESLSGPELCQRVETLVDQFVTPLAEGRQRFVDRFGLAGGSEALNATACGERMHNRVWSAEADGHLDEARSSFTEVVAAFHQAEETVTRLAQA